MKGKRFKPEQISTILQAYDNGKDVNTILREYGVSRITASKYLNLLANNNILKKEKLGTGNYYVNERLIKILTLKK